MFSWMQILDFWGRIGVGKGSLAPFCGYISKSIEEANPEKYTDFTAHTELVFVQC